MSYAEICPLYAEISATMLIFYHHINSLTDSLASTLRDLSSTFQHNCSSRWNLSNYTGIGPIRWIPMSLTALHIYLLIWEKCYENMNSASFSLSSDHKCLQAGKHICFHHASRKKATFYGRGWSVQVLKHSQTAAPVCSPPPNDAAVGSEQHIILIICILWWDMNHTFQHGGNIKG